MARQIFSQHDQRVSNPQGQSGEFFADQHQRTWHAEVEIETGHPCSPFRIAEPSLARKGFLPLTPPQTYMTFVRGQRVNGKRLPYDVFIDYDRWIQDWQNAQRQWTQAARKLAIEKYGAKWDPKEGLPEDVLLLMGNGPRSVAPVQAAKQGHPYVLGFALADPKKAKDMQLFQMLEPVMRDDTPNWLEDEEVAEEVPAPAPVRPKRTRTRTTPTPAVQDTAA